MKCSFLVFFYLSVVFGGARHAYLYIYIYISGEWEEDRRQRGGGRVFCNLLQVNSRGLLEGPKEGRKRRQADMSTKRNNQ